jgi:pilus assembly protein Flp/PilA
MQYLIVSFALYRHTGRNIGTPVCSDSYVWIMEPTMKTVFQRFVKDESGATAIEYGLIAAGIAVAIISVVNGLGDKLQTTFSTVTSQMK